MKPSTYTTIGAFVLAAVALAAAGAVLMRKDSSRGGEVLFETYLEETVQGISQGSAVKYRGIPVGTVRAVEFAMMHYRDAAPDSPDLRRANRYSRIVFSVVAPGFDDTDRFVEMIREHIKNGLHAHVKAQGITGLSYLDLDFDATGAKDLPVPWEPEHLYVPSAPSFVKTLTDVVQGVAQEFRGVGDTKAAIDAFLAEATALAAMLRQDGAATLESARLLMDTLRTDGGATLTNANALATMLREDGAPLLQSATAALDDARAALAAVSAPLSGTVENLARASGDIAGLAEELRAEPSRLIRKQERDTLP